MCYWTYGSVVANEKNKKHMCTYAMAMESFCFKGGGHNTVTLKCNHCISGGHWKFLCMVFSAPQITMVYCW